jgi:type II secretory pathway component PulJ
MISRLRTRLFHQGGTTLAEVIVSAAIMALIIGSMSALVGAAVRGKMITAVRSADTETARATLEWMSERMRNAGLNVLPASQPQLRCQDMVVAQDAALRPSAGSVYVSGEILNSDTTAGNEVVTIGYRLQGGAVMEDRSTCSGGWAPVSSAVTDPRVTVTALTFAYFARNGDQIAVPTTDIDEIRSIRSIRIALTVQGQEGTSGAQVQTFTRMVMFRNPRPDTNNYLVSVETNP